MRRVLAIATLLFLAACVRFSGPAAQPSETTGESTGYTPPDEEDTAVPKGEKKPKPKEHHP